MQALSTIRRKKNISLEDVYEEIVAIKEDQRLREKPLNQQEIADFLGWKKQTVQVNMCRGVLPHRVSPTGGKYSYPSWLNKWLAGVPVAQIYAEDVLAGRRAGER